MPSRGTAVRFAIVALCAAASTAAAAPRVAIGGVRNDPSGAVAAGLAKALCGRLECVSPALVQAGKKIDFLTARRNGVDAVLYGTVSQRGAGRVLALALLRDSFNPVKTWALPLDASGNVTGNVSGGAVASEVAALLEPAAGRGEAAAARGEPSPPRAAPATVEARPAAPVVEREPVPERAAASERAPSAAEPEVRRGSRPPAPSARAAEPSPPARTARGLGAVEIGLGALQRRLTFQGAGASTSTLRDFRDGTLVVPSARAEVFPLAAAGTWYAGLGAFAGYARSIGFQTEDAITGKKYDSVYSALDAGIAYRLPPLGRLGVRLVPAIWYRTLSFDVQPSGGTTLGGLADAALAGVAAGIGLEVPVVRRVSVLADASFTAWTTAKDLVGDAYFKSGSARAFDLDLGAEVALAGPLSLRVLGTFGQTGYSLSGSSRYVATGATDRYVGVRSAIRARF